MSLKNDEQFYQLWLLFKQKHDVEYLKGYLKHLVNHFENSIDLQFKHIQEGCQLDSISMTALPSNFLQVIREKLEQSQILLAEDFQPDAVQFVLDMVKVLIILCRNHENIALIASCEFLRQIIPIASTVLKKIQDVDCDSSKESYLDFINHTLHLGECMYDPFHTWRKALVGHKMDPRQLHNQPGFLSVEFVPFFYDCFQGEINQLPEEIEAHLFHLFGAILSGSTENALKVVSPATVDLIFHLLLPEKCLPGGNNLVLGEEPSLCDLVLKCIVLMVQVIHTCSPEERQVDIMEILGDLMKALHNSKDKPDLQLKILRTIPLIMLGRDKTDLQDSFIKLDIFNELLTVLNNAAEKNSNKLTVAYLTVRTLASLFMQSTGAKDTFKETVGYEQLGAVLQRLGQPSKELLNSLFNMLVDDDFVVEKDQIIRNTGPISIMIRWLPEFKSHDIQLEVCRNLSKCCTWCNHNRLQCCSNHIIGSILDALEKRKHLDPKAEDKLIQLLQSLGSCSITSSELKRLIALIRGEDDKQLSPKCMRLMHSMSVMARKGGKLGAHHYFDFEDGHAGITVSAIHKWPGHAFSFHTWLCLDQSLSADEPKMVQIYRRQLYSFYTSSGMGFEAFFNVDGILTVAICTRREYYAKDIVECTLTDNQWHSLDIVHAASRRPFVQSQLSVYIDGLLRHTSQLKFPALNEPFTKCTIGPNTYQPSTTVQTVEGKPSNSLKQIGKKITNRLPRRESNPIDPSTMTIPVGAQEDIMGESVSLHGLMGSVCIFHDALHPKEIKKLYADGPNNVTLFQREDNDLSELPGKMLLYYDAKACRNGICSDLAPNHLYQGRLNGHCCATWDLKEVINCIGGIEVLFPILELTTSEDNSLLEPMTPLTPERLISADGWEVIPSSSESDAALEQNQVACFLTLIKNICFSHPINQELLHKCQGIPTIGMLLQKLDAHLIDVHVLMAVQTFLESVVGNTVLTKNTYQYLLFDFRIWSKSDFTVRIAHIQYLATVIKDHQKYFHQKFGVTFILDVIRTYYSDFGPEEISREDSKTIRAALFGVIRYYLSKSISKDEVKSILAFTATAPSEKLKKEAIDMLCTLLDSSAGDQLMLLLFEEGIGEILYALLIDKNHSDSLRVKTFKILANLLKTSKVYEKTKTRIRLNDVGYSGMIMLMESLPMSMPITKNLVEQVTDEKLTCASPNFNGLLAVLLLVQRGDVLMKLEATTQLLHMLYTNKSCHSEIATETGWQDTITKLFIKSGQVEINCEDSDDVDLLDFTSNVEETTSDTRSRISIASDSISLEKASIQSREPLDLGLNSNISSAHTSVRELSEISSTSSDNIFSQIGNRLALPKTEPDQFGSEYVEVGSRSCSIQSDDALLDTRLVGRRLIRPELTLSLMSEEEDEEDDSEDDSEVDKTAEVLADTITEILFHVLWHGLQGSPEEVWCQRGQVFVCINQLMDKFGLIRPGIVIKRNLIEKMLEGAINNAKTGSRDSAIDLENEIRLLKLVQDFLFGDDGQNPNAWSEKLIEGTIDLVDSLGIWERNVEVDGWTEVSQISLRILMSFVDKDDMDMCAIAAAKLHHLLQTRPIPSTFEVCFILGSMHSALMNSLKATEIKTYAYIVPLIRAMIEIYYQQLKMSSFLPNLPTTDTSASYFEDFQQYCLSEEWKLYIEKQVTPYMEEYCTLNFSSATAYMSKFWKKCFDELNMSIHKRDRAKGESKLLFQKHILQPFEELRRKDFSRYTSFLNKQRNQQMSVLKQWRASKRFLVGERGTWAERNPEELHWKLSSQENYSRIRNKLTQNYAFDQHKEASQMRDEGPLPEQDDTFKLAALKNAIVTDIDLQDDHLGDEEWIGINPENAEEQGPSAKEKVVVKSVDCSLITLMEVVNGKLEVNTNHVIFYDTSPDKVEGGGQDFKWAISQLREIHLRRFNLRRSAIEIFFIDQTNYFINFKDKKVRNNVYSCILGLRPPNISYYGVKSPSDLLKASNLTQKWQLREISNFDYLMQLNTIAGRTYNDLSQYHVFPWVLADYTSETLDLSNPKVFRDLSKPIGVVNPKNIPDVEDKYEHFEDPSGTIAKFHYGTHYSNPAGVMHYMVRMEPFTTLHIQLQSDKFDWADRQFHSIPSLWRILMDNPNDVKELIPEFFYLPEFLENSNKFDLGRLQTGEEVNDVILPKWADSAVDFIYKHREALESEYVSAHLHEWIDLIFGYKQRGPAAVEALNVFYYCSYEGAVDLDAIDNQFDRLALEGMIKNFGQTPCQLLREPHPPRFSAEEAIKKTFKTQQAVLNLFNNLSELKAFFVEASATDSEPLVYVNVPRSQARSFIHHGMPDNIITVSERGIMGVHGWLPYDKYVAYFFTFDRDPSLLNARTRKMVGGPFSPGFKISSSLFVTSHDSKLLFTGGHWDSSLRAVSVSKGKLVTHVIRHIDIVTCLALDHCGTHLITGSRDTTCMIWEVTYQGNMASGLNSKPLQVLYGHDDEITHVAISTELDMAVSAAKDGIVIIHTVRKGHYIRTLQPQCKEGLGLYIPRLAISDEGHIVLHCQQIKGNKPVTELSSLHVYSINGRHLWSQEAVGNITDMKIHSKYLLTGDQKGVFKIWDVYRLKVLASIPLNVPIQCLSLAPKNSHIFVGLRDGKLIILGVSNPNEPKKPTKS
ncbi:neurobeachin-like protein 1 [Anneissia japonica]|uniref:neurobeachin-like protein 1 n=1 Tax=Anneissia japonica TaxID=1529436 RepID=UPI0014258C9E|nr:neurobeachin-like protein 1 [Anneissia japonica]